MRSPDKTPLQVWSGGEGPPIVLVHGSFTDHTAWEIPARVLSRHFTIHAMDRSGLGASGDRARYTIEREFEDVAAVVDAAASRSGRTAVLWGHSYGANCAMGGAAISSKVDRLILYEPSLGLRYPEGAIEAAETALEAGDRDAVVVHMLFDILEMSREEVDAVRSGPRWPKILAGAHTAPREGRVEDSWVYEPGQFDGVGAPTLFLSGGASPAPVVEATERAAAAIPGSGVRVMEGHGHFAHRTDPEMVLSIITEFVAGS